MTLSETIERYIDLRNTMQSDEYDHYSIPQRRMLCDEMADVKNDIDQFENMVHDMYSMLNRHDDHIYQTGNE